VFIGQRILNASSVTRSRVGWSRGNYRGDRRVVNEIVVRVSAGYGQTKSSLHFDPNRGLPATLGRKMVRTRIAELGRTAGGPGPCVPPPVMALRGILETLPWRSIGPDERVMN
jgi:hypothetical protein